jgi:hypothetical protein
MAYNYSLIVLPVNGVVQQDLPEIGILRMRTTKGWHNKAPNCRNIRTTIFSVLIVYIQSS